MPDAIAAATGGLFHGDGLKIATKGKLDDPDSLPVPTRVSQHVAGLLATAGTGGSPRVFESRTIPVHASVGDHILVHTGDETGDLEGSTSAHLRHNLRLELIVDLMGSDPDSAALKRRLEMAGRIVQVVILNDQTLADACDAVAYVGRAWQGDAEGEGVNQNLRLRFEVRYREDYGALVPDEFLRIGLIYDVADEAADHPSDVISVRD